MGACHGELAMARAHSSTSHGEQATRGGASETRVRGVGGGRHNPLMSSSVTLRAFWDQLSTEGRWLLSTVAVQTLGRGLTLPFTVIYLHEVRGFSLDLAGALMAFIAIIALAVTGPGGALTDRVGARRVLLVSTTCQLVGCAILAFATTPVVAGIAMASANRMAGSVFM